MAPRDRGAGERSRMTKIAVLSDSHDNIWNLARALEQVADAQADLLLHCGDFVAPFVMVQLADAFPGPIHGVFGNNDGDARQLLRQAQKRDNVTLHGHFAELNLDGLRVALNHYPDVARPLAESGRYDVVFYGHNHCQNWERVGACQLINPGEIMGKGGAPSWGLFDASARTWSLRALEA